MRRSLPLFLWISLCSLALCGYSRDLTLSSSARTPFVALHSFQSQIISGKVSDESGVGMPGVNVIVKGTSNGTTTNAEGVYTLSLTNDQTAGTLVFSFIGYAAQEVPINNRNTIEITMVSDTQQLTEVIVVGYGTQEKRDVTGAISSINSEDIARIPSTNTMDAMKGQIAGVDVLQANGRPGDNPSITIRGRRSINASNDPLVVIDGIPMTSGTTTATNGNVSSSGTNALSDFNPSDIQSIEILKDAAATAIYGSRGANGVILITTKRGKSGRTSVNYNGYYGVAQPLMTFPMMNGQQFADLKREASRLSPLGASGRTAWEGTIPADNIVFIDPVELNSVTEGLSTDWQDLVFQNGSQSNHQVSVNGGSEKTQFSMSVGYFNQEGTIAGMDFTRYTARINVDNQIGKRFRVGMSNLFTHSIQNLGSGSVLSEAVNQTPLGLPYDDQGKLIFLPISDGIRSNPLNELVPGKRIDENKSDRIFSSLYAEADIIKGLKYKFLIGTDIRYLNRGIFEGQFTNPRKNGTPAAQYQNQRNFGYTLENLLTYNTTLKENHNIGLTFLQSIQVQNYENHYTSVAGLPYESQLWYNITTASTISAIRSRLEEWGLVSWMGRVNYAFKGKYLLQATLRADGSSRLAPGKKWTTFPGFSAGWRIIEEPFMGISNFLSDLKLRASYGVVGNTSVDPYQTPGRLTRSVYSWDEANAAGFALNEIPNPNKGWEKSATIDVGLDFGLFNGRLSGTLDYYVTNTTDLLLNRQLPITSGYALIQENVGATETKGIEVSLNANIINSPAGFVWDVDFNLASYKEQIVDLSQRDAEGNKVDDTGNAWFHGHPIRSFFDYKKIGIWQANEFDQAQATDQAFPGEIKVQDTDGDGRITPADRVIIGNDVPSAFGGLNNRIAFKGFDFSFFFYYRLGFMLDSRFEQSQATMQGRYNNLNVDYWTIDNPSNEYPRPNKNQEFPQRNTTLRYRDGGFVKLRTISLGYNFPKNITDKLGLSNLRIYVSAQNPKIWSSYEVFDPETVNEVTDGDVPANKLFLGGMNLTF